MAQLSGSLYHPIIKATLPQTLRFIKLKEVVGTLDLVNEFGYAYRGARNRLVRLEKQKLIEKIGSFHPGGYCLTNEGIRRLQYYDKRASDSRT